MDEMEFGCDLVKLLEQSARCSYAKEGAAFLRGGSVIVVGAGLAGEGCHKGEHSLGTTRHLVADATGMGGKAWKERTMCADSLSAIWVALAEAANSRNIVAGTTLYCSMCPSLEQARVLRRAQVARVVALREYDGAQEIGKYLERANIQYLLAVQEPESA